jgi:positive regulator of sigma E activity
MIHTQSVGRAYVAYLKPFGIVLISPLIVIASAAILFGLLGIFILWLALVAAILAAIVVSDIAHRLMRRYAVPPVALKRRVAGYPAP